jgi:3',5'-cyclic AMP phosphodiesterase CpdA
MLFAQITDLHIREPGTALSGRVDTAGFLERAVVRVNALSPRPDFLLITGDLIDGGSEAEYRHLQRLLEPLAVPAYLVLGNHDGREAFRACFPDLGYWRPDQKFVQYALDLGALRLLVLDTHDPGKSSGALCADRLDWLAVRLAEDRDTPTVVVMHHPPVAVGLPGMDRLRLLEGAERFAEVVRVAPNVERILAGHLHRGVTVRFAGTVLDVMPGAAHQVHYDSEGATPLALVMEPPMLQLHRLVAGTGLVSHKLYVDSYGGPQSFR